MSKRKVRIPCPDGIEGCAVVHYRWVDDDPVISEQQVVLHDGSTLIRTEEGIYFSKVGELPPLLEDPAIAADALVNEVLLLKNQIQQAREAMERATDLLQEDYFENWDEAVVILSGARKAITG